MARGRRGGSIKKKLGIIAYGMPFTGKSTFASQFLFMHNEDGSPMRTLILDAESGGIDYYIDDIEARGGNVEDLYIIYTQSLSEVISYINKIKNNEDFYVLDDDGEETDEVLLDSAGNPWRPDCLILDGLTVLNSSVKAGLTEFSKRRAKVKADDAGLIGDAKLVKIEGSGMELKDFNAVKTKGADLILSLIASGVHWIATARETDEKKYEKDSEGKQISVPTGKKIPEGWGTDMIFNAHTTLRFTRDEYGDVIAICEKDRTGVHPNETISNPQLTDWQCVIDGSKGKAEFIVKNGLNDSVRIEQERYAKEVMGSVGETYAPTATTSDGISATAIINEINATMKAMSADERNNKKNALTAASLPASPSAISKITDTSTLNKILEIVKA